MTDNQYMINILLQKECTEYQLNILKTYYKEEIDSKRSYAKIERLADLIKVLIKRDCTSKLDYIVCTLRINLNEVINENVIPHRSPNIIQNLNLPAVLPNIPDDPIQQVYQLIAEEIGQKWKELARRLGIREGEIDDFAERPGLILVERVRQILHYHRMRTDANYWKKELFDALDKVRRQDLRMKVQNIFCRHQML